VKRIASEGDVLSPVHDLHVVEDDLPARNGVIDFGSDFANEGQGDVGEDQAPPVGRAFGIAFVDVDVVSGIGACHKVGKEQPGRTTADDLDFHF